jgi:hypothetical protein
VVAVAAAAVVAVAVAVAAVAAVAAAAGDTRLSTTLSANPSMLDGIRIVPGCAGSAGQQ